MNNWKNKFLKLFSKKDAGQERGLVCGICNNKKVKKYCNFCKKETQNIYTITIVETFSVKESIEIEQRKPGVKGWFVKMFQGFKASMDKDKFPKGIELHRRFDKEKDWYDEIARDEITGRITNECHEPLSKHIGHGSARKNKN